MSLFAIVRKELQVAGRTITLETGKIARQALGSVIVEDGQSKILCTVCASDHKGDLDFFPLSVFYQEKAFAAGKIPGGFLKREGKPSDHEALIARLIDRAIRPLFSSDFSHEVQVICTVLSADSQADLPINAIVGVSAALMLSGLPFNGPVAALRLGFRDQQVVLGKVDDIFDMVVASTNAGVVMVECALDERDEETVVNALNMGYDALQPILKDIEAFASLALRTPYPYEPDDKYQEVIINDDVENQMKKICTIGNQNERASALKQLWSIIEKSFLETHHALAGLKKTFKKMWHMTACRYMIEKNTRLDGRAFSEIRPISCETGYLARSHGSALFTRGQTQALVAVTLGGKEDAQFIDNLDGGYRDNFLMHYNFPPYSVGEVGKMGSPGRREIGHGRLAWRALKAVIASKSLPYTVRIVSEITESNGSSSMATVCGGSLALMDAGIAIKRPVAGIAMGLIEEGNCMVLLSDISGYEDAIGAMDFKVAGTSQGITALQMDLKGSALTKDFLYQALIQAKEGRMHILDQMSLQTLDTPRLKLQSEGPSIQTIQISPDKIRDLIGPGGKNIKELCESCSVKIDIGEDGLLTIFASESDAGDKAKKRIMQLTSSPEVGCIYEATILRLVDFGLFVDFGFSQDGLVHTSEISQEYAGNLSDHFTIGSIINIKCIGFDKGRPKLSMKKAKTEEDSSPAQSADV